MPDADAALAGPFALDATARAPVAADLLTPAGRGRLAGLADAVVHAGDGMPPATDLGSDVVAYVEGVCATDPRLTALLRAAVGWLDQAREPAALAAMFPAAFDVLRTLVLEAYYLDPGVAELLAQRTGWRTAAALTGTPMVPFDASILTRVAALEPSWRGYDPAR